MPPKYPASLKKCNFLAGRYPNALRSFSNDSFALKTMLEPWVNTFKRETDPGPYPAMKLVMRSHRDLWCASTNDPKTTHEQAFLR